MPEAEEDGGGAGNNGGLSRATATLKAVAGFIAAVIALFALVPEARKVFCDTIKCSQSSDTQSKLYVANSDGNTNVRQYVISILSQRPSILLVTKREDADYVVDIGSASYDYDKKIADKRLAVSNFVQIFPSKLKVPGDSFFVDCDYKTIPGIFTDYHTNNHELENCIADQIAQKSISIIGSMH